MYRNFGLFRVKGTVRNIEVSVLQRLRVYLHFGLCQTKQTVRNIEVSVSENFKKIKL